MLSLPPSVRIFVAKHWNRILDGALFATSCRLDWAVLLQRTFGFDALRCPKGDAKMRLLATITEPYAVKKLMSGPPPGGGASGGAPRRLA